MIAQNDARGLEDAATDALRFILSRSASARQALSEFLADDGRPLPITKVETWAEVAHGAVPDLVCRDDADTVVAFIESKFWASLTHHQPVTYWRELPDDRSSVLLFLAPKYRVDEGWLWDELVNRLQEAGHELGPADRQESLVTASANVGNRRLMLTSWESLLERMADKSKEGGDDQACFEIAELQGLAADAVEVDNPRHDDNLKSLIADAVKRLEQSGWGNTDGLGVGAGYIWHRSKKFVYFGRYLRLAGASAWFGIDYTAAKQIDKPLWLSFYDGGSASVGLEAVRDRLGKLTEPGLEWRSEEACVSIDLPSGADHEAILEAMVTQVTSIAMRIDPKGPTYREAG